MGMNENAHKDQLVLILCNSLLLKLPSFNIQNLTNVKGT